VAHGYIVLAPALSAQKISGRDVVEEIKEYRGVRAHMTRKKE
jgi:hypothetical protein